MKFRKPYDFKIFPGLECGPGKTQSHHAEEADINSIVAKFARTGELPTRSNQPQYLDLIYAPKTLQEAQDRLIDARNQFLELPSSLREEFRNSPIEFYDRVTHGDKAALASLEKHGYLTKQEPAKTPEPKATGSTGGSPASASKGDNTPQGT